MYTSAVALTSVVALGAQFAQAAPSIPAEQAKRGLLDLQNCGSDADCPSGWTCNGDSAFGHSCALFLSGRDLTEKREVSARAHGNCDADTDCTKYGSSWYCDQVYDGSGGAGAINVCLPGANDKRDAPMIRRDGTCGSDADCGDGQFCDEYYTFMTGTLSKTTGCFAKPAKRDLALESRAYGNCDADADCTKKYGDSWYCDQVYDGSGGAGAVNVCLPGSNAKRDVDIARRDGTCSSDADCSSSQFCDEYLTFQTGTITKTTACFDKPAKRDVEIEARAHGNCDADSDCSKYGSSWYCDQVYDGSGGAGAINVCLPGANEKRGLGLTTRAHGNCEADSDCKKYGKSWTCDELYDGTWLSGVPIKACLP